MTDATEWLSLPHEAYYASDSLLQLVDFGLREGAEAMATGTTVPELQFVGHDLAGWRCLR